MRLPRDISGKDLAKALARLGYEQSHQTGSHMRLTRRLSEGDQHLTIPAHDPLKVGTLSAILKVVSAQTGIPREDLLKDLFG